MSANCWPAVAAFWPASQPAKRRAATGGHPSLRPTRSATGARRLANQEPPPLLIGALHCQWRAPLSSGHTRRPGERTTIRCGSGGGANIEIDPGRPGDKIGARRCVASRRPTVGEQQARIGPPPISACERHSEQALPTPLARPTRSIEPAEVAWLPG